MRRTEEILASSHSEASWATGQMALALERRILGRRAIVAYAAALRRAADRLESLVGTEGKKS